MKTQISKASHGLAKYSEEYKQQALELWRKSGRSANKVAAELGIRPPLLYRWARAERGASEVKAGGQPGKKVEQLEAEIGKRRPGCLVGERSDMS